MNWIPMICWAAAVIVFAVAEGLTAGLVSVWFAAGALAALIASACTDSILIQMIVFLAVSLAALLLLRPLARRALTGRRVATNADRVIGAEGVVTLTVDNLNAQGQVSVAGRVWTARAEGGELIPARTKVRVLRIEGVKLIVAPCACAAGSLRTGEKS